MSLVSFGPYKPPTFNHSRSPSPIPEDLLVSQSFPIGVELIVRGLEHDHEHASVAHLQRLIAAYHTQPGDHAPIPPLRCTAGDTRRPVDYAFLSLENNDDPAPRPDLLDRIKDYLNSDDCAGVNCNWRGCSGADKSRRIWFTADDEQKANQLLTKLEAEFKRRRIATQTQYVSKGSKRAVFDLLDPGDIDSLTHNPPVFDRHTYFPARPRYIEPLYALEIAVVGLNFVEGVKTFIDKYIRETYGNDSIATSRLIPDLEVYTVVFRYWAVGSRFLTDPFTAFESTHIAQYIGSPSP